MFKNVENVFQVREKNQSYLYLVKKFSEFSSRNPIGSLNDSRDFEYVSFHFISFPLHFNFTPLFTPLLARMQTFPEHPVPSKHDPHSLLTWDHRLVYIQTIRNAIHLYFPDFGSQQLDEFSAHFESILYTQYISKHPYDTHETHDLSEYKLGILWNLWNILVTKHPFLCIVDLHSTLSPPLPLDIQLQHPPIIILHPPTATREEVINRFLLLRVIRMSSTKKTISQTMKDNEVFMIFFARDRPLYELLFDLSNIFQITGDLYKLSHFNKPLQRPLILCPILTLQDNELNHHDTLDFCERPHINSLLKETMRHKYLSELEHTYHPHIQDALTYWHSIIPYPPFQKM